MRHVPVTGTKAAAVRLRRLFGILRCYCGPRTNHTVSKGFYRMLIGSCMLAVLCFVSCIILRESESQVVLPGQRCEAW
jgi:hypothetical protein